MHDILRRAALTALLATSATAAADPVPSNDPLVSPVPLLALSEGKLMYVDPDGARAIVECEQFREFRMLGGPEKGVLKREAKPCSLWNLVVHPPTGRWAMTANISSSQFGNKITHVRLSGRDIPTPRITPGGVNKSGDFIIMGDLDGIIGVTTGRPEAWTDNGVFRTQSPKQFTEDGSRVLLHTGDHSYLEWWSWSFGPRPQGIRVLDRNLQDSAGVFPVKGESRAVLRQKNGSVRIATLEPTGTKPWKIGPPLKNVPRKGMLVPLLVGDTVYYYREGHFDENRACDESKPGTYRRLDLRTGKERVWRTHETWCSTGEFEGLNTQRRTLYFIEGNTYAGGARLYAYSLDNDEVRELDIEAISDVLDISEDGGTLLVRTGQLFQAYNVDTGEVARVALSEVRSAAVLNLRH